MPFFNQTETCLDFLPHSAGNTIILSVIGPLLTDQSCFTCNGIQIEVKSVSDYFFLTSEQLATTGPGSKASTY